jgi:hypothetical protein
MKVKRVDILNLWHALENLKGKKGNIHFSYFIAKNRLKIKDEIDSINEAQDSSDEFKEYDKKRSALAESFAEKGNDGKPVIKNNQYVIQDREKFEKELDKVKSKYKKVISEREEQLQKLRGFLDEDIDFVGHKIELGYLPPDIEPLFLEVMMVVDLIVEE